MKLIVLVDKLRERLHVTDTLHGFPVAIDEVRNNVFNVFPSDKLKKLQARRIQQIVPRHGLDDQIQYRLEQLIFHHVPYVELILQADTRPEELQCRKFKVFFRGTEKLGHSCGQVFREQKVFAPVRVLSHEETERLNEVRV